jgi:hypothetical protein
MKEKQITLVLTMNVVVNTHGENPDSFVNRLNRAASNIINNGMITGDSPATLETFNWSVKTDKKSIIIAR